MDYEILILDRAQDEINQIYEYYAGISFSVLQSFDNDLEQAYQRLETNPFFQFRYKGFRALPFKNFPYLAFFTIDEDEKRVSIFSVFNTYQDPKKYPEL